MNTKPDSKHRHSLGGKYTTYREGHTHEIPGLDEALAAITGRLAALETPPAPPPIVTPPLKATRVTSVPELLTALADDRLDEIVLADGTYRVSVPSAQRADSLWIDERFANRTRPVIVRPETPGGVTFDMGGATGGGITFLGGAHDQDWQDFAWGSCVPEQTGVVVFGGYPDRRGCHDITLRRPRILGTVRSANPTGSGDHGVYFSWSLDGCRDIEIDDPDVDGSGGLNSAFHWYHSDASHPNSLRVTIRRMHVRGTYQAIMLYDGRETLIDDGLVESAGSVALRYEGGSAVVRGLQSTGSPNGRGFYSSLAATPDLTLDACDLR